MEILICAILNFESLSIDSFGEIMGTFYSVFSVSLISVVMPVVLITLLVMVYLNNETLKNKQIETLLGVFYQDYRNKKY